MMSRAALKPAREVASVTARRTAWDFDVMVEAKRKDEAMFRLVEGLTAAPGARRDGQAAVEL